MKTVLSTFVNFQLIARLLTLFLKKILFIKEYDLFKELDFFCIKKEQKTLPIYKNN